MRRNQRTGKNEAKRNEKKIKQKISDVSRNDIQNKLIQTKALSVLKRWGCTRHSYDPIEMCMGIFSH